MGLDRFGGGWFILEYIEGTGSEVCQKSQESAQSFIVIVSCFNLYVIVCINSTKLAKEFTTEDDR